MNLFEINATPALGQEVFEQIAEGKNWHAQKVVSAAHASPPGHWYDQSAAELVVVLKGWGELEFEDGEASMLHAGDWLLIKPGQRHRVRATSEIPPCTWLCFFVDP